MASEDVVEWSVMVVEPVALFALRIEWTVLVDHHRPLHNILRGHPDQEGQDRQERQRCPSHQQLEGVPAG